MGAIKLKIYLYSYLFMIGFPDKRHYEVRSCIGAIPHSGQGKSLRLWASRLSILPYHLIVLAITLPPIYFKLPRELVGGRSCCASSLLCQSFTLGFLGLLFTSLLLLGFVGQHFCCASPFHHFISWASLAYLLSLYHFYSYGLFVRSFGLLRPNYHIFTSYYFLSLLAFRPTH